MIKHRFQALTLPALGAALVLAGCSGPDLTSRENWFSKPFDVSSGVTWSSTARHQISRSGPLGPDEFVDAQGNCAPGAGDAMAAAPAAAATPAGPDSAQPGAAPALPPGGGVALEMSECEVVRRTGVPDRVEVGSAEGGERSVTITYLRGPRPGIYRFSGGRLTMVEKAPDTGPQRPVAKPKAKAKPKQA